MPERRGNLFAPPLLRAARAPQRRDALQFPDARAARFSARALSIRRVVVVASGTGTRTAFLRAQRRAHRSSLARVRRPPGLARRRGLLRPRAVLFVAGPHVHVLLRLESRLLRRGRPLARPARAPHLHRERGSGQTRERVAAVIQARQFRLPERGSHETAPGGFGGGVRRARLGRRNRGPVRLYPKRRVPDGPAEEGGAASTSLDAHAARHRAGGGAPRPGHGKRPRAPYCL